MKRILSLCLAVLLSISAVPMVYAADVDYTQGTAVTYTGTGVEEYTVTVPAELTPGADGNVIATGTFESTKTLRVTADETVVLTNSINANDTKELDIEFDGISLPGNNMRSVSDEQKVSVADIQEALFGIWSGRFNYYVSLDNGLNTPLKFGEKYICTEDITYGDTIIDMIGTSLIFYEDGSVVFDGETTEYEDVTLPAGTFEYIGLQTISQDTISGFISPDGITFTGIVNDEIDSIWTLESEIQNPTITFTYQLDDGVAGLAEFNNNANRIKLTVTDEFFAMAEAAGYGTKEEMIQMYENMNVTGYFNSDKDVIVYDGEVVTNIIQSISTVSFTFDYMGDGHYRFELGPFKIDVNISKNTI